MPKRAEALAASVHQYWKLPLLLPRWKCVCEGVNVNYRRWYKQQYLWCMQVFYYTCNYTKYMCYCTKDFCARVSLADASHIPRTCPLMHHQIRVHCAQNAWVDHDKNKSGKYLSTNPNPIATPTLAHCREILLTPVTYRELHVPQIAADLHDSVRTKSPSGGS